MCLVCSVHPFLKTFNLRNLSCSIYAKTRQMHDASGVCFHDMKWGTQHFQQADTQGLKTTGDKHSNITFRCLWHMVFLKGIIIYKSVGIIAYILMPFNLEYVHKQGTFSVEFLETASHHTHITIQHREVKTMKKRWKNGEKSVIPWFPEKNTEKAVLTQDIFAFHVKANISEVVSESSTELGQHTNIPSHPHSTNPTPALRNTLWEGWDTSNTTQHTGESCVTAGAQRALVATAL